MKQIAPIDRIARAPWLDGVAGPLRDLVAKVLRPGRVKDLLHGVWLGHPVHPAMAQLSFGCFTGAAALDATGDRGDAASRLIGLGLATSVPTAAAGLADYADGHEEQQRIGVVHAAANAAGMLCYLGSLGLRRSGNPGGRPLGLLAYGLLAGGAAIGGDLAFRWATGPNHAAEVPHAGPAEWTDLGAPADFPDGQPVRVQAGLIPVLVRRQGGEVLVMHDRCSHMAGPLHQGDLVTEDGHECVVCPWHHSAFRLSDGAIVRGPATAPQPVLDSRIHDGRVQAKVREIPGVPAS